MLPSLSPKVFLRPLHRLATTYRIMSRGRPSPVCVVASPSHFHYVCSCMSFILTVLYCNHNSFGPCCDLNIKIDMAEFVSTVSTYVFMFHSLYCFRITAICTGTWYASLSCGSQYCSMEIQVQHSVGHSSICYASIRHCCHLASSARPCVIYCITMVYVCFQNAKSCTKSAEHRETAEQGRGFIEGNKK